MSTQTNAGLGPQSLNDLLTPALLVDVDRLEQNISSMARHCASVGVALRPHVKTSKCWQVARLQLAAGASGFTCSTPAEVTWLQDLGVSDLLWAHQPVGPRKVEFAIRASRRGRLVVALDSIAVAEPLSRAAHQAGVVVRYVIEVDTGHGRAGVPPSSALSVTRAIAELSALSMCGVMTHEGHLSTFTSNRAKLEGAGRQAGEVLAATAAELRADGHVVDIVSVGSTPGATSAPLAAGISEARPGTYVYYDANQVCLSSATVDECALSVMSRVVSTPTPGRAIIDAGIKAMSSDAAAIVGTLGIVCDVDLRPLPEIAFSIGNEEHGFLTGPGVAQLVVGDLVRVIPNHACGTTNMFGSLWPVVAGRLGEAWPICARH